MHMAVGGSAVPPGLAGYLVFHFSACCVHGCFMVHIIMKFVLTAAWIYFSPNAGRAVLPEKAVPAGCTPLCALDDTELAVN